MTAYTAHFPQSPTGRTISLKNSKRVYSHAWLVYDDQGTFMTGWAGTEALARSAAASIVSGWTVKPTRGQWGRYWRNRTFTPHTGVKTEIVPVTAA